MHNGSFWIDKFLSIQAQQPCDIDKFLSIQPQQPRDIDNFLSIQPHFTFLFYEIDKFLSI